jgi:hypothetical protein
VLTFEVMVPGQDTIQSMDRVRTTARARVLSLNVDNIET